MADEKHSQHQVSQGPIEKDRTTKQKDRERIWREAERFADEISGKLPNWDELGTRIDDLYKKMGPFIDSVVVLTPAEAERIFSDKFKAAGADITVDYAQVLGMFRILHQLAQLKRAGKFDKLQSPAVAKAFARKKIQNPKAEIDLEAVVDEVCSSKSSSVIVPNDPSIANSNSLRHKRVKKRPMKPGGRRNKYKI